jgi:signal transduction histidine kinase
MNAEWLVVVNADGTVLAVEGAPADWIGTRVEERADVSEDVRQLFASARQQFGGAHATAASTTVASHAPRIRVVPVHAVPVHRRPTDLRALLTSIVTVMAPQARAIEVAFRLEVGADLPPTIMLDAEKIAWTLTALVGNALRFVRHGTSRRPGGTIIVRANHLPDASEVVLEVTDDGVGIRADVLAQLLRRSSDASGASALALKLVQDIIAAHGGAVHIESSTEAWASGTTVRLTIPCR